MSLSRYILRRFLAAVPLLLGVTLVSFFLMVHFGPDRTYISLGKNPTAEEIAEVRGQLGYDRPVLIRYGAFLRDLLSLDLGRSDASGEPIEELLARTFPISVALVLPGFIIGNVLGLLAAMLAAWRNGSWIDRVITGASVAGMSLSFLVIIIVLQLLLCTPWGFDWFPARGWSMATLTDYLRHVTVPTLALVLITLGYNTRFYRSVLVEELGRDHVLTARAFGAGAWAALSTHVLRNGLAPILTRLLFSIPMVVISGSLLLESYFGIPGIGKLTFDAITNGDQPVLLAVVSLTAVLFILAQVAIDLLYRLADPRVSAS